MLQLHIMTKIQYNVKIEEHDIRIIKKISLARGDDVSDFIRISIRKELARLGFLKKDEAKALEVEPK